MSCRYTHIQQHLLPCSKGCYLSWIVQNAGIVVFLAIAVCPVAVLAGGICIGQDVGRFSYHVPISSDDLPLPHALVEHGHFNEAYKITDLPSGMEIRIHPNSYEVILSGTFVNRFLFHYSVPITITLFYAIYEHPYREVYTDPVTLPVEQNPFITSHVTPDSSDVFLPSRNPLSPDYVALMAENKGEIHFGAVSIGCETYNATLYLDADTGSSPLLQALNSSAIDNVNFLVLLSGNRGHIEITSPVGIYGHSRQVTLAGLGSLPLDHSGEGAGHISTAPLDSDHYPMLTTLLITGANWQDRSVIECACGASCKILNMHFSEHLENAVSPVSFIQAKDSTGMVINNVFDSGGKFILAIGDRKSIIYNRNVFQCFSNSTLAYNTCRVDAPAVNCNCNPDAFCDFTLEDGSRTLHCSTSCTSDQTASSPTDTRQAALSSVRLLHCTSSSTDSATTDSPAEVSTTSAQKTMAPAFPGTALAAGYLLASEFLFSWFSGVSPR